MKRLTRPLPLIAATLMLMLGAAGITALVVPMPTDAAIGPAGAGTPEKGIAIAAADCPDHIVAASRGFSVTLASLSEAAQAGAAKRCTAYRAHVVALTSARDIYAACLSGFARDDQVAQLELAARDWRSVITGRCGD
jgi:hypothetical protein